MEKLKIGIIGGTGLYKMEGLKFIKELDIVTPFGAPSDSILETEFGDKTVYFLPRHGRGHLIPPNKINYRANIFALKKLGVNHIISVSAVGSLREEIKPGDIVVPDQFYDITKARKNSFFEEGLVAHVSMADPLCDKIRTIIIENCKRLNFSFHSKGTYICIDGPQFSTRGESFVYRQWKMDIIGMTNVTEAKLAREAEICYSTIALVTDYDCWHETEEEVSVDAVISILNSNISKAQTLIRQLLPSISGESCKCQESLKNALMTSTDLITPEIRMKLGPIIEKYINK